jgi:hypothetical protein
METIDNIFIKKQIIEMCSDYNIDIRKIYLDYTHTFDSVKRN